ncbi:Endonuclease domain-containing 1 protein [Labeo rohita]|uniref:Endonuclease domain-containing 1 protein n=1 Tax=Labeo rohita TaxID=84645 RepID=A0ABQ8LB14_LABRO|nr:Endonuclease domain-containing 1 protein [Labeo rohita]
MFVLGLITCVTLRGFSAQAKVVDSFEECKEFFYNGKEPSAMDQNAKKICQKLENSEHPYYATLYSPYHKIPLYSAYTLDPKCSSNTERKDIWNLEPQVTMSLRQKTFSNRLNSAFQKKQIIKLLVFILFCLASETPYTETPSAFRTSEKTSNDHVTQYFFCRFPNLNPKLNIWSVRIKILKIFTKKIQAISSDYTGYDRGHLNPSSFQSGDGRNATFTLTNAAPMDVCFNRVHWNRWERKLRSFLLKTLARDSYYATAFIVTGTVPDASKWIPYRTIPVRVSVPSHIWTAVCYKHHSDDKKSFSFGYMGENNPAGPDTRLMSVSQLNDELSFSYRLLSRTLPSFAIFSDNCFGINNKLAKVQSEFKKLINLQENHAVQTSSGIRDTYQTVNRAVCGDSTSVYSNNIDLSQMTVKLAFDSMSTYYNLKVLAGSASFITYGNPLRKKQGEPRKREVSTGSDAVECQLVPENQKNEKTAADGTSCYNVHESDYSCRCYTGGETVPCCSTPCLYMDKLKGYRCYSDQKLIECSPPYSLITVNGERCRNDFPCATYGLDYYWCFNFNSDRKHCSPPQSSSTVWLKMGTVPNMATDIHGATRMMMAIMTSAVVLMTVIQL